MGRIWARLVVGPMIVASIVYLVSLASIVGAITQGHGNAKGRLVSLCVLGLLVSGCVLAAGSI